MPQIGEVRKGRDIEGITASSARNFYIWLACSKCGKERWVVRRINQKHEKQATMCRACYYAYLKTRKPKEHPCWVKSGRFKRADGYVLIRLTPDNPYWGMADKDGYVREHRLVIAQHLNRCLKTTEEVHHLNGTRDDNRLPNLGMVSQTNHPKGTLLKLAMKRIRDLEAQLAQGKLI